MGPEELLLEIDSLGNRVGGISRRRGEKTVFVRGGLPGELVLCRPVSEKKSFVEAELLEVRRHSPRRTAPSCPHYSWCGGCSLQHLRYGRQLHWKREWVRNALSRRGIDGCEPSPTVGSPAVTGYRNRVTFQVTGGVPGLHAFRGDPRPVDACPLLSERGNAILGELAGTDLGAFDRVAVRSSTGTVSDSVELYGAGEGEPELQLPEAVSLAWERDGRWRSRGPGLRERLAGVELEVPPGGFLQVNTGAAELLVSMVAGMCGQGPVLDLYAGVGTMGLSLAAGGRQVLCVERSSRAVRCGRRAAGRQGIDTVEFRASRARSFLVEAVRGRTTFGTVVADPPRAGLGTRVARLLRRLRAPRVIMVGCDPFAMARDLDILLGGGYRLDRVQPLDLFPQTDHVETVALLLLNRSETPTEGS
ncbi:MAG: methyltransferase [Candidatus Fermentibacteraceae bacterium]